MELCGSYVAEGLFQFTDPYGDDQRSFSIPFVCECDTTYECAGTPGFWRNRPEEWPVSSLMIGGVSYSIVELLDILDIPVRGRMTVKLAHHLIAAKLNVLVGTDPSIQGAIDDGDAYLMAHSIGSRPRGAAKEEGEAIKDALVDYNESTCPEDFMDGLIPSLMQSGGPSIQNSGSETKSWGEIKKLNK
jgi:hypothetical protein